MSRGFRLAKVLLGVLVLAALSACGGGGGGSSGASTGSASTGSSVPKTPGLSVSFNPTVLNVSADASVSSAPTATITLTLNQLPASGVQIGGGYTGESISDVSVEQTSDTTADLTISFDDPSVIGPGTYDSTLTVTVCPDTSCTSQATGSPANIPVHYTVTGVKRPHPAMVLSQTSLSAQGLAFASAPTSTSLPLFSIVNGAGYNISVTTTHTSNAISNAGVVLATNGVGTATVYFKSGVDLGEGVYNDTITLSASCSGPCQTIDGATQTISVQYTVSNTVAGPEGFAVRFVNATVNDLTWNNTQARIYFTSPGNAPAYANTVSALDPATATVETSSFVGSEPGVVVASDDGQYLYVGLGGSTAIRRKSLPTLTQDILIPLGSDPNGGGMYANDIQVAPGQPHTIAVARRSIIATPSSAGVVIFDDASARASIASGFATTPFIDWLQWGSDATTLYGYEGEGSGLTFSDIAVDASGAHVTSTLSGAFLGRPHFLNGILYSDGGDAYDPVSHNKLGIYAPSGSFSRAVVPDAAHNRLFMLNYDSLVGTQIRAFNLTTFTPISSVNLSVPLPDYGSVRLIRWGSDGLAFATDDGRIMLINGPFVSNVAQ